MEQKYSLLSHNTFGIDVSAACFLEYASVDELRGLIGSGRVTSPYLHIGGGSNLLFTKDYEGTILHSRIGGVEIVAETDDDIVVRVGAGVVWDDFVDYCVQRHWYGVENLSLIPGHVGATPVQNIGAYGTEAGECIDRVEAVDIVKGERVTIDAETCRFSYRDSIFKHEWKNRFLVTYVTFRLAKHPEFRLHYGSVKDEVNRLGELSLKTIRQAIIRIREAKLPDVKVLPNAGSFFKNPMVERVIADTLQEKYPALPVYPVDDDHVKLAAGWLIETAGWKGKVVGHAGVHDKQALVLVNTGGATGIEIAHLANEIKKSVFLQFGVWLEPEVNVI